jgi:23S rRNA (cytosine1962-C5)-methyltransferase
MAAEKRTFDVVVVDPAKLAGVRAEISRALKTYDDINRLAMQVVRPGGILLS